MADVDAPAGIGEHLQHETLGLGRIAVGLEHAGLVPRGLPTRIGGCGIETLGYHGATR